MKLKILFATTNIGKIERMKRLNRDLDIEFVTLKDLPYEIVEPDENGANVVENAEIKARYYWEKLNLKMPVIAEDQGTYFIGVKEVDNPYKDVKKPVVQKYGNANPENVVQYYSDLAKKYGGIVPEVWDYGFAIFDGENLTSDKAVADNVRIVETPKYPAAPGFPFSCICQHKIDGQWKYYSQITTTELEDNFEPPIKKVLQNLLVRYFDL
jgi:hypothetical protein